MRVPFDIESTHLGEIKVIVPKVFEDHRGYFMESYRQDAFAKLGVPHNFVQDNQSRSVKGVVRGLHFQTDPPMAKLMRVVVGSVFLVAVDIRAGSPTLGQWFGLEVSADNKRQVFAPPGFARGFCVLSDAAELHYKCSAIYNPATERTIRWDDATIGIQWPVRNPILSEKDANAASLELWLESEAAQAFAHDLT
jgi:dTDP-4-dehydrorhamnose 3,5-epimerase